MEDPIGPDDLDDLDDLEDVQPEEPADVTDVPEESDQAVPVSEPEPTGHAGVDAVLEELRGLDERSVHEHVEVFEQAHASLRQALDADDEVPEDDAADAADGLHAADGSLGGG